MFSLFKAEWTKTSGNLILTSFLVWIYPIGIVAFLSVGILIAFLQPESAEIMFTTSSHQWAQDMIGVWRGIIMFPANIFSRMLPLAYMAVVFAGEYQWGTWKNIIPRSQRWRLIIVKYIVLTLLYTLSYIITSILNMFGNWIGHTRLGMDYGPALTWVNISSFLADYGQHLLLGFLSLWLLACFAAVCALFTRSILGSLLAGFGFATIESLGLGFLSILSNIFSKPELVDLYAFFPSYHLDNALSWYTKGEALTGIFVNFTTEVSLAGSLTTLFSWAILLTLFTILIFKRQDITS